MPDSIGRSRCDGWLGERTKETGVSPHPHAPGVHVNKIGCRVVADATATCVQRGVSQLGQGHIRETDIDRLPCHVQAAGGDALAAVP